jgi:hypothetical protein
MVSYKTPSHLWFPDSSNTSFCGFTEIDDKYNYGVTQRTSHGRSGRSGVVWRSKSTREDGDGGVRSFLFSHDTATISGYLKNKLLDITANQCHS